MEAVRERSIRLSDGAQTTLQQWGDRGPLVLAVHGVGGSRRGWARIGEHLVGTARVVAYDQRGHGDSTARSPMTVERILDHLGDVVASLGEPVDVLMGHSWGGAVAIVGGCRCSSAVLVASIRCCVWAPACARQRAAGAPRGVGAVR